MNRVRSPFVFALSSLILGVSLALAAVMPAGATSDVDPPDGPNQVVSPNAVYPQTLHVVKDKSRISTTYTRYAQVLGRCTVYAAGATCTISAGRSATRTVELSGGISRNAVTASLGISNSTTVSTAVSCTSPPLGYGLSWAASPQGHRWQYKVTTTIYIGPGMATQSTSGWLYAFDPKAAQITCYMN